jgi:hypothetical protein
MNDQYANGEGDDNMKPSILNGPSSGKSLMTNLTAKPIKTPGARGFTRKKALPKRSMGFSYKK